MHDESMLKSRHAGVSPSHASGRISAKPTGAMSVNPTSHGAEPAPHPDQFALLGQLAYPYVVTVMFLSAAVPMTFGMSLSGRSIFSWLE